MLSTDRSEFETHLGAMFGAWNRVLSQDAKEGYWKGCQQMALSEFIRSCSKAIQSYTEESSQRLPDVGAIWAIKRGLRTTPAVTQEKPDSFKGDHWDVKANIHLLAYIHRRPKRYSDGNPKSEYTKARTALIVAGKNEWAQYMRESDGHVEIQDQKDVWANCMQAAEKAIDAL